ncbi:MAG: hypothetical protein M1404_06970 [Acidobacteria bacterium]|nr:hypothetical protein [Acidobacteriota bacterium]
MKFVVMWLAVKFQMCELRVLRCSEVLELERVEDDEVMEWFRLCFPWI